MRLIDETPGQYISSCRHDVEYCLEMIKTWKDLAVNKPILAAQLAETIDFATEQLKDAVARLERARRGQYE